MLKLPIKCLKLIFDTQNLLFCDEKCSRNMFLEFFFPKIFLDPSSQRKQTKKTGKTEKCQFFDTKSVIYQ